MDDQNKHEVRPIHTPMKVRGTAIGLANKAGGFDVSSCPDALALAAFIGTACNTYEQAIGAVFAARQHLQTVKRQEAIIASQAEGIARLNKLLEARHAVVGGLMMDAAKTAQPLPEGPWCRLIPDSITITADKIVMDFAGAVVEIFDHVTLGKAVKEWVKSRLDAKFPASSAAPLPVATKQSKLIETLNFALQDALGFAELVESYSKPDVEMFKHELRNDSELAQRRINVALQAIEDADVALPVATPQQDTSTAASAADLWQPAPVEATKPLDVSKVTSVVRNYRANHADSQHEVIVKFGRSKAAADDFLSQFGGIVLERNTNLAAPVEAKPEKQPLIIRLPDCDPRRVEVMWDGMEGGKRLLCIDVKDQVAAQTEQDANRYRWLCDRFGVTKLPVRLEQLLGDYVADGKEGIDAAIDAAILATKEQDQKDAP